MNRTREEKFVFAIDDQGSSVVSNAVVAAEDAMEKQRRRQYQSRINIAQ